MWTVILVTFTASVVTLSSMRKLRHTKLADKKSSKDVTHTNYLVQQAEFLPQILNTILKQLHPTAHEVTLEIIFMPTQVEFMLHIPSTILLPEDLISKLVPMDSFWTTLYNPELVIDDTDSISNTLVAHQIIVKSKTPNVVFVTTRGVKRTPSHYNISGIDTYKWEQFINRRSDSTPDLITHDRIFTLIQEKLMTY
ncbi:MAG: ATP/GTP-binding protein [bacterium]|nr:ATP/GTP-binding protein [bacterium]